MKRLQSKVELLALLIIKIGITIAGILCARSLILSNNNVFHNYELAIGLTIGIVTGYALSIVDLKVKDKDS